MKRFIINVTVLSLVGLIFCGALWAIGPRESQEAAKTGMEERVTLTLFDKNCDKPFTNPVAKEITRRTGVFIEILQPTGNPDEKLNLMLASGDLPDIAVIDRRSPNLNRYIAAGALIVLDDLIAAYGPNIVEMYGDVLNKARYEDGHNYYLNNWYGVDPDPGGGIDMRMDVLEEFGYGERAAAGDYFTQDEFLRLLVGFQEKYPEIGGRPSISLSSKNYPGFLPVIIDRLRGMYGMKTYYEVDRKLMLEVRDPRYLDMVRFLNSLNRKGLLDPEWAITNTEIFVEKAVTGRIFAFAGGMTAQENGLLQEQFGSDTDKQFFLFKVAAPGIDPSATTYGKRSSLGWDALGITVVNEYPEKTMEFFNFLASEEGQYLMMWGIEGEQWDMVDGKHKPRPGTPFGWGPGWSEYQQATGVRSWTWLIKNGYGADGTPYDLIPKYTRDAVTEHAIKSMAGSVWDTAPYDNLGPLAGTEEAVIEQKLNDIMIKRFAEMVNAQSPEQLDQIYERMMQELEANDAEAIEAIYSKNYSARMDLWY